MAALRVPAFLRVSLNLLRVGTIVTLLVVFKQWAYVATYRLYLDHRVDDAADSTATQRFDVEEGRVVPKIVMRDDRVSFLAAIGQDSTILAKVSAAGPSSYEIHVRQKGTDGIVARGDVTGPTFVVGRFPTGNGVIELVSHGELTWSDLRLRRDLRITPEVWLLGLCSPVPCSAFAPCAGIDQRARCRFSDRANHRCGPRW